MKTQAEVRDAFWEDHSFVKVPGKMQNDYPTDVRCAFVDYVDMLARDGLIDEALASRVTL
jgi:hypothetical protein